MSGPAVGSDPVNGYHKESEAPPPTNGHHAGNQGNPAGMSQYPNYQYVPFGNAQDPNLQGRPHQAMISQVYQPTLGKIGNPGPLGLIGFALTTFVLGLYQCGAG
jgi:hypothetical protein